MTNYINGVEELKPGRYIRAVVNCYGQCWYSVEEVLSDPYLVTSPFDQRELWEVKTTGGYSNRYYCSDLGAIPCKSKKLYPFSTSLALQLDALLASGNKHNREFTEFIRGEQYLDDEWEYKKLVWERTVREDRILSEIG